MRKTFQSLCSGVSRSAEHLSGRSPRPAGFFCAAANKMASALRFPRAPPPRGLCTAAAEGGRFLLVGCDEVMAGAGARGRGLAHACALKPCCSPRPHPGASEAGGLSLRHSLGDGPARPAAAGQVSCGEGNDRGCRDRSGGVPGILPPHCYGLSEQSAGISELRGEIGAPSRTPLLSVAKILAQNPFPVSGACVCLWGSWVYRRIRWWLCGHFIKSLPLL